MRGHLRNHQSDVCLIDEGRGLAGLPGRLLRQFLRRQCAKLVKYQRQQLLRRLGTTLLDSIEDAGGDYRRLCNERCG